MKRAAKAWVMRGVFLAVAAACLSACAPLVVGGAVVTGLSAVDRRTTGTQVEDEGIEDDFAELSVRAVGSKWEIKAESSYPNSPMTVKFRKPGVRTITWNFVTTTDGTRRVLTSRNLSGGTLILSFQGNVVDRISVG